MKSNTTISNSASSNVSAGPVTAHGAPLFRVGVLTAAFICLAALDIPQAHANPTDGVVTGGAAVITAPDATTVKVDQSTQNAAIEWQDFSVKAGEQTVFNVPNADATTLNKVVGNNLSEIFGKLSSNGKLILVNPNGIVFGSSGQVDANGLVSSTLNMDSADFMNGSFVFRQSDGKLLGKIINNGNIKSSDGGYVMLLAPKVENNGLITATTGQVVLASGTAATIDFDGNGKLLFAISQGTPRLNADGTVFQGGIDHNGEIAATGGQVVLTAKGAQDVLDNAINVKGNIRATSVSERNGVIELNAGAGKLVIAGILDASGKKPGQKGGTITATGRDVNLKATAQLDASGFTEAGTILVGGDRAGKGTLANATTTNVDAGATLKANNLYVGDGGKVIVWSDVDTKMAGSIEAKGGLYGGNGGFIETSGKSTLDARGALIDASARRGFAGTWLLDPTDLLIDIAMGNTIAANLANNDVIIETDATNTGSQKGNITLADYTIAGNTLITWSSNKSLTLRAHDSIVFGIGSVITNTGAGSITLIANKGGYCSTTNPVLTCGNSGSNDSATNTLLATSGRGIFSNDTVNFKHIVMSNAANNNATSTAKLSLSYRPSAATSATGNSSVVDYTLPNTYFSSHVNLIGAGMTQVNYKQMGSYADYMALYNKTSKEVNDYTGYTTAGSGGATGFYPENNTTAEVFKTTFNLALTNDIDMANFVIDKTGFTTDAGGINTGNYDRHGLYDFGSSYYFSETGTLAFKGIFQGDNLIAGNTRAINNMNINFSDGGSMPALGNGAGMTLTSPWRFNPYGFFATISGATFNNLNINGIYGATAATRSGTQNNDPYYSASLLAGLAIPSGGVTSATTFDGINVTIWGDTTSGTTNGFNGIYASSGRSCIQGAGCIFGGMLGDYYASLSGQVSKLTIKNSTITVGTDAAPYTFSNTNYNNLGSFAGALGRLDSDSNALFDLDINNITTAGAIRVGNIYSGLGGVMIPGNNGYVRNLNFSNIIANINFNNVSGYSVGVGGIIGGSQSYNGGRLIATNTGGTTAWTLANLTNLGGFYTSTTAGIQYSSGISSASIYGPGVTPAGTENMGTNLRNYGSFDTGGIGYFNYTSGIAHYLNYFSLNTVENYGTIGASNSGGLFYELQNDRPSGQAPVVWQNLRNYGSTSVYGFNSVSGVGGIAALIRNFGGVSATLKDSFNQGDIGGGSSTQSGYLGGIAYQALSSVNTAPIIVDHVFNYGSVTAGSFGSGYGYSFYLGGLFAQFQGGIIKNSANYGSVMGQFFVGGLVAELTDRGNAPGGLLPNGTEIVDSGNYGDVFGRNYFDSTTSNINGWCNNSTASSSTGGACNVRFVGELVGAIYVGSGTPGSVTIQRNAAFGGSSNGSGVNTVRYAATDNGYNYVYTGSNKVDGIGGLVGKISGNSNGAVLIAGNAVNLTNFGTYSIYQSITGSYIGWLVGASTWSETIPTINYASNIAIGSGQPYNYPYNASADYPQIYYQTYINGPANSAAYTTNGATLVPRASLVGNASISSALNSQYWWQPVNLTSAGTNITSTLPLQKSLWDNPANGVVTVLDSTTRSLVTNAQFPYTNIIGANFMYSLLGSNSAVGSGGSFYPAQTTAGVPVVNPANGKMWVPSPYLPKGKVYGFWVGNSQTGNLSTSWGVGYTVMGENAYAALPSDGSALEGASSVNKQLVINVPTGQTIKHNDLQNISNRLGGYYPGGFYAGTLGTYSGVAGNNNRSSLNVIGGGSFLDANNYVSNVGAAGRAASIVLNLDTLDGNITFNNTGGIYVGLIKTTNTGDTGTDYNVTTATTCGGTLASTINCDFTGNAPTLTTGKVTISGPVTFAANGGVIAANDVNITGAITSKDLMLSSRGNLIASGTIAADSSVLHAKGTLTAGTISTTTANQLHQQFATGALVSGGASSPITASTSGVKFLSTGGLLTQTGALTNAQIYSNLALYGSSDVSIGSGTLLSLIANSSGTLTLGAASGPAVPLKTFTNQSYTVSGANGRIVVNQILDAQGNDLSFTVNNNVGANKALTFASGTGYAGGLANVRDFSVSIAGTGNALLTGAIAVTGNVNLYSNTGGSFTVSNLSTNGATAGRGNINIGASTAGATAAGTGSLDLRGTISAAHKVNIWSPTILLGANSTVTSGTLTNVSANDGDLFFRGSITNPGFTLAANARDNVNFSGMTLGGTPTALNIGNYLTTATVGTGASLNLLANNFAGPLTFNAPTGIFNTGGFMVSTAGDVNVTAASVTGAMSGKNVTATTTSDFTSDVATAVGGTATITAPNISGGMAGSSNVVLTSSDLVTGTISSDLSAQTGNVTLTAPTVTGNIANSLGDINITTVNNFTGNVSAQNDLTMNAGGINGGTIAGIMHANGFTNITAKIIGGFLYGKKNMVLTADSVTGQVYKDVPTITIDFVARNVNNASAKITNNVVDRVSDVGLKHRGTNLTLTSVGSTTPTAPTGYTGPSGSYTTDGSYVGYSSTGEVTTVVTKEQLLRTTRDTYTTKDTTTTAADYNGIGAKTPGYIAQAYNRMEQVFSNIATSFQSFFGKKAPLEQRALKTVNRLDATSTSTTTPAATGSATTTSTQRATGAVGPKQIQREREKDKLLDLGDPCISTSGIDIKTGGCTEGG